MTEINTVFLDDLLTQTGGKGGVLTRLFFIADYYKDQHEAEHGEEATPDTFRVNRLAVRDFLNVPSIDEALRGAYSINVEAIRVCRHAKEFLEQQEQPPDFYEPLADDFTLLSAIAGAIRASQMQSGYAEENWSYAGFAELHVPLLERRRRMHAQTLSTVTDAIAKRNLREEQDEDIAKLKSEGYPYSATPDEYRRFIRNKVTPMKILGETISLADILAIFVPSKKAFRFTNAHTYIVGRGGSGKTELLKAIYKNLSPKTPRVVIDPHGDFAEDLARGEFAGASNYRFIAPHRRRFVVNPFDIADKSAQNRELVAQEITDLIGELIEDVGLSRLMQTIMFPVVYTLLKLPYADFKMLADCINPNTGKDRLQSLRAFVEPHHASIWHELEEDTYDTSKQSVFNRLQSLLNYRLVLETLCGYDDFTGAIRQLETSRETLIFSLPIPVIGETVAVTLGRFLMTRMQIWAKHRQAIPEERRFPVVLMVDEFHNFVSYATAQTLDQFGRKFGLFMVLAHQHLQQLTDREIRGSIMANTRNKIAGMSNAETRVAMQKEMGVEASELEDLRPGHFIGKFGERAPFLFYARRVSLSRNPFSELVNADAIKFAESKNTSAMPDGWRHVHHSRPNTAGKSPAGTHSAETGEVLKPKFDI